MSLCGDELQKKSYVSFSHIYGNICIYLHERGIVLTLMVCVVNCFLQFGLSTFSSYRSSQKVHTYHYVLNRQKCTERNIYVVKSKQANKQRTVSKIKGALRHFRNFLLDFDYFFFCQLMNIKNMFENYILFYIKVFAYSKQKLFDL